MPTGRRAELLAYAPSEPFGVAFAAGGRVRVIVHMDAKGEPLAVRSDDDGQTWQSARLLPSSLEGFSPSVVLDGTGPVIASAEAGRQALRVSTSSAGRWVTEDVPFGDPICRVATVDTGAVDVAMAAGGELLLAYGLDCTSRNDIVLSRRAAAERSPVGEGASVSSAGFRFVSQRE